MDPDSDNNSLEGEVDPKATAEWGKTKYDYYYTDYVDKDYPSKLNAKEERLAAIEQEEALRIQKKLLADVDNLIFEAIVDDDPEDQNENLLSEIEQRNREIESRLAQSETKGEKSVKKRKVQFQNEESDGETSEDDSDSDGAQDEEQPEEDNRRPINMAILKNRGLTPYKKKEYRNPRVKHKLKYKKAMSKRRRNVREAQTEFYRYSGESAGIKTSTIKSISLS